MSAKSNDADDTQPARRKLISKRNDLSIYETPEITWEFYNAYHSAKPTRAAYLAGTNSIEDDNLDTFFKPAYSRSKFSSLDSFLEEKPSEAQTKFGGLPHPFNLLMPMQDPLDGRWFDLKKVLHILKLPRDTRLEKATQWEMASAFVVAMIRQRVEMFDVLQEYHDKVIVHFPTTQLIQQAKEIILIGDLSKDMQKVLKDRGVLSGNNNGYNNSDSDSDYDSDGNKLTIAQKRTMKEKLATGGGKKDYKDVSNEKWKPKTDSLLAHTNAEVALEADPSMRLPDQMIYEQHMQEQLNSTVGGRFMPRPKLTTMKMMGTTTLIPVGGEIPSPKQEIKPATLKYDNYPRISMQIVDEKKTNAETGTVEVDADYVLASDEEWASDSDDNVVAEAAAATTTTDKVNISSSDRDSSKSRDSLKSRERGSSRDGNGKSVGSVSPGAVTVTTVTNGRAGSHSPTRTGGLSRGSNRDRIGTSDSAGGGPSTPLKVTFNETGTFSDSGIGTQGTHVSMTTSVGGSGTLVSKLEGKKSFTLPPDSPPLAAADIVTEGNDGSWELDVVSSNAGQGEAEVGDAGSVGTLESMDSDASLLTKSLRGLTPKKDQGKILRVQSHLDAIMVEIVNASMAVEEQVVRIKEALVQGIIDYNSKLTYEERNLVFDQVTAMLGDDYLPREGFFDWRGTGVPGMRPRVIRFFCLIHEMAGLRLTLEELNTPEGRDPKNVIIPIETAGYPYKYNDDLEIDCPDISRWAFVYNGVDVVHKVLHCLDFLRAQKELCSWYGRMFYCCGNPLMLSFNIYRMYDNFDMTDEIKKQLTIKPHVRPMCVIGGEGFNLVSTAPGSPTYERCNGDIKGLSKSTEWKFEKYLIKWRVLFDQQCKKRFENWPNTPSVKADEQCLGIWTSMLVMYLRCKKSLVSTYFWEKKFIGLLSTVRGKDLMIGSSGIKPDLLLDRQTEKRFLEVREEAEEKRLKAIEDKKAADAAAAANEKSASLKFLSSIMAATAKPTKAPPTKKSMARDLAKFEKKLIFTRLTTPKPVVMNPHALDFDYPFPFTFEGYSSVLADTHRPQTADDLGFGRSPSRSRSPVPGSEFKTFDPLKLRPISPRLYRPPTPPPVVVEVVKEKKVKMKYIPRDHGSDEDSTDEDERKERIKEFNEKHGLNKKKGKMKGGGRETDSDSDESSIKAKMKKKKSRPKSPNKKKGGPSHGERLLRDVVAPGETINRTTIAKVAGQSSLVSRVKSGSGSGSGSGIGLGGTKMTRRVEEPVLPPVRRGGGGALTAEMRTPIVKRVTRLGK